MSNLFGGGQKDASGGILGDVLATENNTVGMVDAGLKSAIQGSFFFQAEDGIRGLYVTGVQTCALLLDCRLGWSRLTPGPAEATIKLQADFRSTGVEN